MEYSLLYYWKFGSRNTNILYFCALKNDWIVNCNGGLEKIKYITSAMNYLYEHFDPNSYIVKKKKNYIEKLLNWEIE